VLRLLSRQSAKTSPQRGARGYDGGKKVKGRKRHILVDTMGMILKVVVHEANIQDQEGGKLLLKELGGCFPRLKLIWAESAYEKGNFEAWVPRAPRMGCRDGQALVERGPLCLGGTWARASNHSQRFPSPQMALDCGANLRLALHLASARQGLGSPSEQ